MIRRAPVAVLLTLAAGASFAAAVADVPSASATPVARPVLASHRPSAQARGGIDPAALMRRAHRVVSPAVRGRATTTVAPHVLDPGAAALPAGPTGRVAVSVTGDERVVAARTKKLGGRVLTSSSGVSSVVIAKAQLSALAGSSGVTAVQAPVRPHTLAVTSEGVAASQADAWQQAGTGGAGVTIGVVDAGFTGLAAAETAGDLSDTTVVENEDCIDDNDNPSTDTSEHGTAVAEIVHQMAPQATLQLYCVASNVGFASAANDIVAYNADATHTTKIKIVSSSLGFSRDGRGDGTGATSGDGISTAFAVERARRNGILWIQSAGNNAENHWSGTLADADKDKLVDIDGVYSEAEDQYEDDVSYVAPGTSAAPSVADIELQWDQWPTTNAAVTLQAFGFQCTTDYSPEDGSCGEFPITLNANGFPVHVAKATPTVVQHVAGSAPYAEIDMANPNGFGQYWVVFVQLGSSAYPTTRYDLTYQGDVDGPSYLACTAYSSTGCTTVSPRSSQGSISAPASSPYALAVGAADVGADGTAKGTLELFSSQGPSIDGRTKPDITAWDGVSSAVYGVPSSDPLSETGFYGTSAAAPHVAGAAALALQADPSLDTAQLQNFLEQRASTGAPKNPPTNQLGHGLLTLGAVPSAGTKLAPNGSRYLTQDPTRILDTRTATGGHQGKLGAGGTVTVPVTVPDGAKAVAINLTGANATATTYLTAYPGGTSAPNASNLNLSKVDPQAAVFAVVSVNTDKTITIRNNLGAVDVIVDQLGYFGTDPAATDLYAPLAQPIRALDTRTTESPVLPGTGRTVALAGAPAGATAAVVDVTVTNATGVGYVNASATCSTDSSTVNLAAKITRANLAIVKLDSAGSFCLSDVGHAADVIVDVVGYMGASGSEYFPLPSTTRIVDTRTGNGLSAGGRPAKVLAAHSTTAFYGANVGDVPASASALLTGVVEATATSTGYLELFPGTTAPDSPTSNLNFTKGRTVPNAAIVGLNTGHQFGIYNDAGSTDAAVDVFGYFAPVAPA